jgi:hypothetical protein
MILYSLYSDSTVCTRALQSVLVIYSVYSYSIFHTILYSLYSDSTVRARTRQSVLVFYGMYSTHTL